MKSKAWLTVTSAAKHQLSQHQQNLLCQQSLPAITSIRPYLSSSNTTAIDSAPPNVNNNDTNQTPMNREQIRNMAVAAAAHYYPIYNQPSYKQKRFFRSSATYSQSNALAFHEESQHHKALPLLNFFSKSYAKPVPSYIFAHGASGFAKRQRYTTPDLNKNRNEHYYSIQIGEDAYFRRSDALGVADGVGGWTGVSGKYSFIYTYMYIYYINQIDFDCCNSGECCFIF